MNKKTVIIYASMHHGNTLKLVREISNQYNIKLIDATKEKNADLQEYEIIGFASGIDFGKFYDVIENFARDNLPVKKKVFFLYTCAMERKGFTNSMREIVLDKESTILGEYGCKGYNTYGPWKLIGGMNKNHPTRDELMSAVSFFEKLYLEESDERKDI